MMRQNDQRAERPKSARLTRTPRRGCPTTGAALVGSVADTHLADTHLGETQVQTHSESESDRTVLAFRSPAGEAATVIVMRRHSQVWLTFNGALKTTVAMKDPEAGHLIEAVVAASRGLR